MAKVAKEIIFYSDIAGNEPFNNWLNGLRNSLIRRRIFKGLFRIESGNYGDKSTQTQDIKIAKAYWKDYLTNEKIQNFT